MKRLTCFDQVDLEIRNDADGDVPMLAITDTPQTTSNDTRSSRKSRVAPKGGYRIPQQGQLQVIIKNPHKTAVKLFLIPYDLPDMQPGHKTFIRQRSYSAGPILDMPLDARKNLGTDRPVSIGRSQGCRPYISTLGQVCSSYHNRLTTCAGSCDQRV